MMPYPTWVRHLLDKAQPPSARLQQVATFGLQIGLAFMAFVSLHPYFMWGYQKLYYAIATLIVLVSCAGCFRSLLLTRKRLFLAMAFSLFFIYLSLLPKVHGAPTRWFLLIPFTVALLTVREEDLQKAFEKFYWIFALSLVPGMLVWVWVVAGLPFEFRWMTPPSDYTQRGIVDYGERPGVVVLLYNSMVLPNGGIMFRLCGMLDEGGTVGTIAALCLATVRFRLRDIKGTISFIAGIMSFSVAFALLTVVGFIATAVASKRPWLLVAAITSAAAGAISLSGLKFDYDQTIITNVTIVRTFAQTTPAQTTPAQTTPAQTTPAQTTTERFRVTPTTGLRLRVATEFDDRAEPKMRQLLADYMHSSAGTLLVGLASNASNIYAGNSAVWTSVLVNYGIIGFVWLFVLFFTPLVYLWRSGRLDISVVIFCALYLISFYQRPVIWLPAQMLIFFSGLYYIQLAGFWPKPVPH